MGDLLHRRKVPALGNETGQTVAAAEKRVLFYVERNLHLAFLEPIHDYLAVHSHYQLCFCSPPYRRAEKGVPGFGLETAVIRRLRQKSAYVGMPEEFAPQVTVVADACFYPVKNCGKVIDVGHGLISKGFFYKDAPIVRRENLADVICVPGRWHKSILEKNVYVPIRISGFLKTDAIYHFGELQKQAFLDRYRINKDHKILLYAPTFNEELSSLPCIREKIVALLDDDRVLLVKLHGMTAQEYIHMYERLAADHDNLILIDDRDFAGAMVCAQVMISDVSSACAEFMLMNKPIVLFNNPLLTTYARYDPTDIEHRIRDALIEVHTVAELTLAVKLSLADPNEYASKRQQYAAVLNGPIDGHAAKRVAETVIDLLDGKIETDKVPAGSFSIIYQTAGPVEASKTENIRRKIAAKNKRANFELLPVQLSSPAAPSEMKDFRAVCAAVEQAKGDIVVLLKEDRALPDDWLFWMGNYFRYYPDAAAVKCLSASENYQEILNRFEEGTRPKNYAEIADYFFYCLMGNELNCDQFDSDCLMVKRDVFERMPQTEKHCDLGTGLARLRSTIARTGGSCWYAPEIFCYPDDAADNEADVRRASEILSAIPESRAGTGNTETGLKALIAQARTFKKEKAFAAAIRELLKAKDLLHPCQETTDADGRTFVLHRLDRARTLKKDKKFTRAIAELETVKAKITGAAPGNAAGNSQIFDMLNRSREFKKNREYQKSIDLLEQAKLKIA